MTAPTVGRKVWFWPSEQESYMNVEDDTQPLDATVLFVHKDERINLLVVDHLGHTHPEMNVLLIQEGETKPEGEGFATWMPYQVKQHAKAEAAEEATK